MEDITYLEVHYSLAGTHVVYLGYMETSVFKEAIRMKVGESRFVPMTVEDGERIFIRTDLVFLYMELSEKSLLQRFEEYKGMELNEPVDISGEDDDDSEEVY